MSKIELHVDRDGLTGQVQLSIWDGDSGYRIAGPDYSGHSRPLLTHALKHGEAKEIESYLKKASVHRPYTDDGITYCGWDGWEGCGKPWPCPDA